MTLREMARAAFVPAAWLREQAAAGELPALRAGELLLFHPPTVYRYIGRLAQTQTGVGGQILRTSTEGPVVPPFHESPQNLSPGTRSKKSSQGSETTRNDRVGSSWAGTVPPGETPTCTETQHDTQRTESTK
jgi:hypothetical protein